MTGAEAAYRLYNLTGVTDVRIVPIAGNLTDNYNLRIKPLIFRRMCIIQEALPQSALPAMKRARCQHAQAIFL
jgi:Zn-dependent membrane protease YugP